ncbi:hypothetical protein PCANC_13953 [Puccinia coronata f. sp. avenae]|uniref:No apical meristem-associated C-terminal domain-containing protein n=1 Tax=Puccinia coronata f. sp. avenae TaxID=200324 RepID=A0A2N5SPD7_9BASI|nr:hypothetical protein PCANC_13288 [Puccinia coronata f. sp. avenae]PLW36829.1 hypothetical protein PCANC_13953 [Puccinia coronata f. sp. avenae]
MTRSRGNSQPKPTHTTPPESVSKCIKPRKELPYLTAAEYQRLALGWLDGIKLSLMLQPLNDCKNGKQMEQEDLKRQWNRVYDASQKFTFVFIEVKQESTKSGDETPEKQLIEMAKEEYYRRYGWRFHHSYELAWSALYYNPKWRAKLGFEYKVQQSDPQTTKSTASTSTTYPASEMAPSRSSNSCSAPRSERKPDDDIPRKIEPADVKPSIAKRTPSTLIFPSEPRDTPAEPIQITTTQKSSTAPSKSKNPPVDIKPGSHKRSFHEVGDHEQATHISQGTDGKRGKEVDMQNRPGPTVSDAAPAECEDIDRLQLEVRHMELKMEYERLEMEIMEKDLSSCTDEYEKDFYRCKKRKILARLKD